SFFILTLFGHTRQSEMHPIKYGQSLNMTNNSSKSNIMRVVIQPPSLIETGIKVEKVNNRPLFKFTDRLQLPLETLLKNNKLIT
ncbi:hypothetical protein QT970_27505, partial [Microcoleus sp. herbarium8]